MFPVSPSHATIVAALNAAPLDRVRLMKVLFLTWHRRHRPPSWHFDFVPYLYGPCAFGVYDALESLEEAGLVSQAPHPNSRWGRYYLTRTGREAAERVGLPADEVAQLQELARWSVTQDFRSLLESVYREAPDFATRSVFA